MITVYTNGDFISFDEHSTTYSVMVEDKGKIAYMGYNVPICYDGEKTVDLQGKAVVPALNDVIAVEADGAVCSCLKEGESADFAVLDQNVVKLGSANVLDVYIKGRDKSKTTLASIIKKLS